MRKIIFVLLSAVLSVALFACATEIPTAHDESNVQAENFAVESETPSFPDIGGGEEIGAVNGEGVDEGQVANEATGAKAVYVRAKANGINVRSGKGTGYSSLGSVDKGDMLAYLGEEDGWYKTYYRSKLAYISAKSAYTELYTMNAADEETENVISVGLKLLGTPYVYGAVRYHNGAGKKLTGFTINEFDCSSLMQYMAYMGANKLLDLTTRTQIKQGIKVDKNELRRGDLMFFTNASRKNKTGIERVGHVAMYLGDNYILHTASDHAVIEEISATRWSYFIQANRILSDQS